MQVIKDVLASKRFNDTKECLQMLTFWSFIVCCLPILIPIWLLLLFIFVHEKHRNSVFIICYDTLYLRWLLDKCGARKDEKSAKIMKRGFPCIEYFKDLPTLNNTLSYYGFVGLFIYFSELTGYVPDFMRIDPKPTSPSALYTTRIVYIDDVVEKGAKSGEIEQLLVIGAGWDFRGLNTAITYPKITVIEVDTPKMIEMKTTCCRDNDIKYDENVTAIALKLNAKSDLVELSSRIDMRKKTLIILEGVSLFLNFDVNEAIIELLRGLPAGSELISDYWIKESCSWKFWNQRYGKWLLRGLMRIIGEPITFELPNIDNFHTSISSYVSHFASGSIEVAEASDIYVGVLAKMRRK